MVVLSRVHVYYPSIVVRYYKNVFQALQPDFAPLKHIMPAPSFSFIHAADLHLGAAFSGLTRQAAALAEVLEKAAYTALDNLGKLALTEKPAAVLLAGDVYNRETGSAKALLALRDACAALGQAGINVFMVHGNHDPLTGQDLISWPDTVHIFGSEAVGVAPVLRDGEPLALVHGISHNRRDVTDNLAAVFNRDPQNIFQIGLLHCQTGGANAHLPYAPCGVEDLIRAGMDYWALGHVHKRGQVCAAPPAWYPGNIQGLHINEDGPKGCLLVEVREGRVADIAFKALGPVQWVNLAVSLQGADKLDIAEQRARRTLEEACAKTDSTTSGYIARLVFEGHTELNSELRANEGAAALLERLRAWGKDQSPFIWIKDILPATAPLRDLAGLEQRDDLLGETLRRLKAWRQDPEARARLLEGPLAELYGPRASQARGAGLAPPSDDELHDLLTEAAFACLESLSPLEIS